MKSPESEICTANELSVLNDRRFLDVDDVFASSVVVLVSCMEELFIGDVGHGPLRGRNNAYTINRMFSSGVDRLDVPCSCALSNVIIWMYKFSQRPFMVNHCLSELLPQRHVRT